MDGSTKNITSRRDFLKNAGRIAAASALAGAVIPEVQAAGGETIQLALIGAGGRGTGAAEDALSTKQAPVKLIAMADVFQERVNSSHSYLSKTIPEKVDVPPDRRFIGFDAYRKAMDCLKPGDVAIFASPPAFRWVHFTYAIQKGLHVFMEKPVTVDVPTSHRMIGLAAEADKKNLKVGVGLMIRHCRGRQELKKRIDAGEIGDILTMRAYRMSNPAGFSGPRTGNISELLHQVKRFHGFLWASGGLFSDFYIHQIDECSWMKGSWPVKAQATGGRHFRGDAIDQNFDNYSVEYTYPDGTKLFLYGRNMRDCYQDMASYAHGTKGLAIISTQGHTPGKVRIFAGQLVTDAPSWAFPQPEPNPYRVEWEDLFEAILKDRPYSEVKRGVEASLVGTMGRMAAHTGQEVTYEQLLKCAHEFAPDVDKVTMDSPAPLQAGPDGKYPVPQPGRNKEREY